MACTASADPSRVFLEVRRIVCDLLAAVAKLDDRFERVQVLDCGSNADGTKVEIIVPHTGPGRGGKQK
jgi:hypothetical protein